MRRHWRKTALVVAGAAAIATVAGTGAAASSVPPAGAAAGYDERATCGDDAANTSNIAAIEAPDPMTVVFELCAPDVAFPSKVAFSAFQIHPSEAFDDPEALVNEPIGTGPYMLGAWERGSQIVLEANPDYWGDAPLTDTAVFQWQTEAAQRLVQLEAGTADGIDNVGTDDFERVESNPDLQLIPREPLNIFYLGFNVDLAPFDDPVVREAIGLGLDRQRLVDNFYPGGSVAATQFLPSALLGYDESFVDFEYDPDAAAAMIAEAYPDGLEVTMSLRDVARSYLPQPVPVATDIQAQLAEIGIDVTIDVQESTTFLDNANAGLLPFHMLGWGADYPDPTNFFDFHFGSGASPQFGTGFGDIHEVLTEAGSLTDPDERFALYQQANELLAEHIPMVPVAHGGSGVAFKAGVEGAHSSPLGNEAMAVMGIEGQDQFVWVQNGEPGGLYCGDETDGESLRVCEQIAEPLLGYEIGGTDVVPALAESWESNEELTIWTFHLREGVTFHDGSEFDATDVLESYRVAWDAADPRHVGRTGDFVYWGALFGGHLNPPAVAEE